MKTGKTSYLTNLELAIKCIREGIPPIQAKQRWFSKDSVRYYEFLREYNKLNNIRVQFNLAKTADAIKDLNIAIKNYNIAKNLYLKEVSVRMAEAFMARRSIDDIIDKKFIINYQQTADAVKSLKNTIVQIDDYTALILFNIL